MEKTIQQGDVWLVNLEPSRKGELGKVARPSIVIQSNDACEILDTVTIVPTSSNIEQFDEIYILIKPSKSNGLNKQSAAICSHLYTLSKNFFIRRIGKLNLQEFSSVISGIKLHLDIDVL